MPEMLAFWPPCKALSAQQPAAHYVLNLVMSVQTALHNHVHVQIVADLIMYSIEAAQPTNLKVK